MSLKITNIHESEYLMFDDPDKNIIEDPDIPYLFAYIESRFKIKKQGFSLTGRDSNAYFKLRHNVFKNYICFLTGLPNLEEKPFTNFFIQSNRTPDFLIEEEERFILIEYTVCNKIQTAYEVKESMTKYNPEIEMMSARKPVWDYYLLLGLDCEVDELCDTIKLMVNDLNLNLAAELWGTLNELRDSLLYLNWHINCLMPELLMNDSLSIRIPISDPLTYIKPFTEVAQPISVKRTKNIFIRKMLINKTKDLLKTVRRKSHSLRYKVVLNFKTNEAFLAFDPSGISKNEMTSLLQSQDDRIFDHCILRGNFDDIDEPFIIYGDSDVKLQIPRNKIQETKVETHNYQDRVFVKISNSNQQTLSDCILSDDALLVDSFYKNSLEEKHKHQNIVARDKNPFIFPLATGLFDVDIMDEKPTFCSKLSITNKILAMSKNVPNFQTKTIDRVLDYDKMLEIESKLSKSASELRSLGFFTSYNKRSLIKAEDLPEVLREPYKNWSTLKKDFKNLVSEETRLKYKNRINIPMSLYKKEWDNEIEHYRNKTNEIEVYPYDDFDIVKNNYDSLFSLLFSSVAEASKDQIFSDTEPQGTNLRKTCSEMQNFLKDKEMTFRKTVLSHNLLLISRLFYSLSYYSNIKLNKNDFCVDNLGYDNVLLIVKGGKKIFRTRRSRFFKIIVPINSTIKKFLPSTSMEFCTYKGITYAIYPWRQLKQDYLKKGMEMYHNFSNYYISSSIESSLSIEDYNKFVYIKVLNMFSQKRKLEIWFSALRYIYFNSLGTHSAVLELIPDMIEYNYDSLFYLVQQLFLKNYLTIFESMRNNKIFDMYWEVNYENFDLCAEKFEETVFMTKAPFDNTNEHVGNLTKILKVHESFFDKYKTLDKDEIYKLTSCEVSDDKYVDDLFSDDFKFDPKLCFLVGKHTQEVISTQVSREELAEKFKDIMSISYTNIQTSKGMRATEGPFWGKKGFEVVYDLPDFWKQATDFLSNIPKDAKEFDKFCNNTHISFMDKMEDITDWEMEFDMSDKMQYKGSREIYIMTDKTKIMQQPLEKFFKILCSKLPNEIIHKKSHDRPKFIHSKLFEYSSVSDVVTYCTLDCRKWAPKSNLWKYLYFVLGMRDCLPDDFFLYFLIIWKKMFSKSVKIQARFVDILNKNEKTKHLTKLLTQDGSDYRLYMPYSFMMGIFNYLSSLFHAGSQLYFDKFIASKLGSNMRLLAHSDDSGGVIFSKSYERNIKTFRYYEIFQKGCNHLMSKKKSVLAKNSFELISIMYHKKALIPMTHKFITNVSFDPKGAGWNDDVSTTVSKVVDLFSNGGTLLQCYSMMLVMGEMLRKFYHLPRSKMLSTVPLALGGIMNMHPLHLIMLGADAQELMLDLCNSDRARDFRINLFKLITGSYISGKGSKVFYRVPYFKTEFAGLDIEENAESYLHDLTFYQKQNTFMDTLRYFSSLRNQKFSYSLSGIDTYKILFSTLFFKHKVVKMDNQTETKLSEICNGYMQFNFLGVKEDRNFLKYSNDINYLRASESIYIEFDSYSLNHLKTCKPIVYNTFMNLGLNLDFSKVSNIIAFNSEHNIKQIMNDHRKWEKLTDWALQNFEGTTKDKIKALATLERKDLEKRRSAYLFIPSGVNIDTTERFWTYTLLYCTRRYMISTKKPQFYTLENFEFWTMRAETLKHHFLIIKLANNDLKLKTNVMRYAQNIESCGACRTGSLTTDCIKEVLKFKNMENFEYTTTYMPFAIYKNPQHRGKNVWFGNPDFNLYSRFGWVEHKFEEGVIRTIWRVGDVQYLDELWHIYKIFCDSRGVGHEEPSYGYTGDFKLKVAFNDLNVPFISNLRTFDMILENSVVILTDVVPYTLQKLKGKMTYNQYPIDLEIYHIYDINKSFIDTHGLENLKDLYIDKEFKADKEILKKCFSMTKIYKVLNFDNHHKTRQPLFKKYRNEGFLGTEGSFSKALCLADHNGFTKFKSSINPTKLELGVFETQSISDVPIIDMMQNISFMRLSYSDSLTMEKLVTNKPLNDKDVKILEDVVAKLGLKTSMATITIYKHIFKTLMIGDLSNVPFQMIKDFMAQIIKALAECMEPYPKNKGSWQYLGSRKDWFAAMSILNFSRMKEANNFSYLFITGLIRAKYDNPLKFWDIIKENALSATLNIHPIAITNLFLFMRGIFFILKENIHELFSTFRLFLLEKRERRLDFLIESDDDSSDEEEKKESEEEEKKESEEENSNSEEEDDEDEEESEEEEEEMSLSEMIEEETDDLIVDCEFDDSELSAFTLLESEDFEDDLDYILGGELPEVYSMRDFKGHKLRCVVEDIDDLYLLQQLTLKHNFSSVEIYCRYRIISLAWLGPGDFSRKTLKGRGMYHSSYPGVQQSPIKLEFNKQLHGFDVEKIFQKINSQEESVEVESKNVEDTLSEFYRNEMDENNLKIIPLVSKFLKEESDQSGASDIENFFNLNSDIIKKISENVKMDRSNKTQKNYLPGFTGVLKDNILSAELEALFGSNYYFLLTGQVKISNKSYKMIMRNIKDLIGKCDNDHKSLLFFLLAVLKDCIISEKSDDWFLDSLLGILDDISSEYDSEEEEEAIILPPLGQGELHYDSYYDI